MDIGIEKERMRENEIDLIAVNELDRSVDIVEIKRRASNIDMELLGRKSAHLTNMIGELKDYTLTLKSLSMDDM